jgi:hypothetical protein
VIGEAAKTLPEGWTARIESGVGSRPGGSRSYHPHGLAADVRIYDANGTMVGGSGGWYQNPKTFRLYEQFAQAAKAAQTRMFPQGNFAWGGYFVNKGPGSYGFADLMHMQWGGPMAGGTWAGGAQGITRQWLEAGGGTSAGMGQGDGGERQKQAQAQSEFDDYLKRQSASQQDEPTARPFTSLRNRAGGINLKINVRGPRGVTVASDSDGAVSPAAISRTFSERARASRHRGTAESHDASLDS